MATSRSSERRRTAERVRGTPPEVELAAKRIRRTMTPAEEVLWHALRDRRLDGLKFRRQQPMGPFILDFYCATLRLVVELDGAVRAEPEQQERDAARTAELEAYGYRVLRFSNEQVLDDLPAVLSAIRSAPLSQNWERGRG